MNSRNQTHARSRERILASATEEFAAYGLAGARVDRIARRADINKAMIYYHFGSKEQLYQAIIDQRLEAVSEFLLDRIARDDLESTLRELSGLYHILLGGNTQLAAIFMHEIADGGTRLKAAIDKFFSQRGIPGRLKETLDAGIRAGRYRDVDSVQTIISFIGMNLFYLMVAPIVSSVWEITDEKKFRDDRPAQVVDLLMRGILVR
jgi:AcrR family transcriptional regulator